MSVCRPWRRGLLLSLLVLFGGAPLFAQTVKQMEFRDQPIADILLAFGRLYERSILPDETVTGRASYYASEADLESALRMFLPPHHLYHWYDNGICYVSRLRISVNEQGGTVDLDADSVEVDLLIERLARAVGRTILSDGLAGRRVTLHVRSARPDEVVRLTAASYPELAVDDSGPALRVRRVSPAAGTNGAKAGERRTRVIHDGALFSLHSAGATLRDAVGALFEASGGEVAFLDGADAELGALDFRRKRFEEMLQLLTNIGGSSFDVVNGTYYIHRVRAEDILGRLDRTAVIPLRFLSAEKLRSLLPAELSAGNHLRIDAETNSVIIHGSRAELAPYREFLERLDRPPTDREYYRFDLTYIDVEKLLRILPQEFASERPATVPGSRAFILPLSAERKERLERYIETVDTPDPSRPVRLRYIRVADLLAALPPGIDKREILPTADPSLFFFSGNSQRQHFLRRELALVDRPPRQIRYELLVVQYTGGSKLDRELELSADLLHGGERNAFLGSIGRLAALNFDIVSAFGYLFALDFNLDLATARARILADTTLNGISGEQITFRNTDTYRYRDALVNPDTGALDPTGVVREITSGLIIGITGWASGDGIVTMDITSTVSARGADTTGSETALPTTSEKIITTHVRTPSGTPVVIGGLMEHTANIQRDETPLLSKLPLFGWLFRKESRSTQKSELSVYILPHVERPAATPGSVGEELQVLYERLVAGDFDD